MESNKISATSEIPSTQGEQKKDKTRVVLVYIGILLTLMGCVVGVAVTKNLDAVEENIHLMDIGNRSKTVRRKTSHPTPPAFHNKNIFVSKLTTTTISIITTTNTIPTTTLGKHKRLPVTPNGNLISKSAFLNVSASSVHRNRWNQYGPQWAVDGQLSRTFLYFYHSIPERMPWFQIEFRHPQLVSKVEMTTREREFYGHRFRNVTARVGAMALVRGADLKAEEPKNEVCGTFAGPSGRSFAVETIACQPHAIRGKYLQIVMEDEGEDRLLEINEIDVFS